MGGEMIAGRARRAIRRMTMLSAAGAVLILSACAPVGPNYARPTAPTPSALKMADAWKESEGWKQIGRAHV
jgi:hypothetical protein